MKLVTYLILFLLQIFSLGSLANKDAGNGGDVVACRNPQSEITSIEMLDYYEARELRHINIELDIPVSQMNLPETVQSAALQVVERIRTVNPSRAEKYARYLKSFFTETLFVTGKVLTDIPDSDHLFLPLGCQIEQIAIQQIPRYAEDPRYIINQDLWIHLPFRDAVGLLLHEVIYREMISAGFVNSIPARYFNSLVSSHTFDRMALRDYIELAARIPLPDFDYRGFTLTLCYPETVNGELVPCRKVKVPSMEDNSGDYFVVPARAPWAEGRQQTISWQGNAIPIEGGITLEKTGFPSHVNLSRTTELKYLNGTLVIEDGHGQDDCQWDWESSKCNSVEGVTFYNSGQLASFTLLNFENIPQLSHCTYGLVTLYENGSLNSCEFSPALIETDRLRIRVQGMAAFDPEGSLIKAEHVTEGVLYLKNPRQEVAQIRSYLNMYGFLRFKTDRGANFSLSGELISFGPGEFILLKDSEKIYGFMLSDGGSVKLNQPQEFFPYGAQVSQANFNPESQIPKEVKLFSDTQLNSQSGFHIYPAQSYIEFDGNGFVTNCYMPALSNSNCYLR